jgi:hypothetical protein
MPVLMCLIIEFIWKRKNNLFATTPTPVMQPVDQGVISALKFSLLTL